MTLRSDTIAAIATAPGRGGVAVVRVSGPDAFAIARTLTGKSPRPGRISFGRFFKPDHGEVRGDWIDEGIVLAFKAPHSYTGEDVIEFQCHGGTVTPRRVLEACFAAGSRLAERGEFTARAYYNGRLALEAAEGVIALVDAKTDRAADAALEQLDGARNRQHRTLYDEALRISSELEHALDIDEGELPPNYLQNLNANLSRLKRNMADARAKARSGKMLRDGARVVLAGAPNAGKSSLLNALLGEQRAIVSATPGTTRDVIETWLDIEGWPVCLIDTAGLRQTNDAIEAEGVARANALIAGADVVLALDCNIQGALRIHAKCDLDQPAAPRQEDSGLPVSARTGEGLDALKRAIAGRLEEKSRETDESSSASERDLALLARAYAALEEASACPEDDLVLIANSVRICAETLGELTGSIYSSDLLDTIFSRFCVGK